MDHAKDQPSERHLESGAGGVHRQGSDARGQLRRLQERWAQLPAGTSGLNCNFLTVFFTKRTQRKI